MLLDDESEENKAPMPESENSRRFLKSRLTSNKTLPITVHSKGNEVIKPVILQRNFIEFAANVFGFLVSRWESVVQWLTEGGYRTSCLESSSRAEIAKRIWCSCLVKNGFS